MVEARVLRSLLGEFIVELRAAGLPVSMTEHVDAARALTAITNPTTNSFKRLVPGFEAPVNFAYSARNRSAAIRIPTYSSNPKAVRIEFRTPDPAARCRCATGCCAAGWCPGG